MEEKRMKNTIGLLACIFLVMIAGNVVAQEYDHTAKVEDMTFSWKIVDKAIQIKLSGETTGWVGIGFNPSSQMKDAGIVIGYVKKGKVTIEDDFGDEERGHKKDDKLGGKNDITVIGGEEKGKTTTIEFSMPLNSGDKYDSAIDPNGETVVLLAYGGSRDSFRSKHKFRTSIKVNLATGKVL